MSDDVTVRGLLTEGRGRLANLPQGLLEAEVLLFHVLGVDRAWLYANSEKVVSGDKQDYYAELIGRRGKGEPIAYLTGVREFWSLPFEVTPDVLIPRPETELLVETALDLLPAEKPCRVADLGTGSGAVALAIASERPLWEMHATELSPAALEVAQKNAESLLPGRVQFHEGSWLDPLHGRFDLLVSNPPYVVEGDRHLESGDCRFEPRLALTPGSDGLHAIRRISCDAVKYLKSGGCLAFEHGFDQGAEVRAVLGELAYANVETRRDLENRERITLGYR